MAAMRRNIGLVVALAIAGFAAACGPATPPPDNVVTAGDKTKEPSPPADATVPPAATGSEATPAPGATAGKPGDAPVTAKTGKASTPLQASKMLADVKGLGIDLTKSPELGKIPIGQKKKLMPFFQKSLGYEDCTGCHAGTDYKKETRNIKIAREMWKHFVAGMRDEKGNPIFCDSCHVGSAKNLNRDDQEVLKKFMEDEYEHKLTRADKKENECTTCHGDAVELKIIEKLWKIPKG
jgi:hypothetical protein